MTAAHLSTAGLTRNRAAFGVIKAWSKFAAKRVTLTVSRDPHRHPLPRTHYPALCISSRITRRNVSSRGATVPWPIYARKASLMGSWELPPRAFIQLVAKPRQNGLHAKRIVMRVLGGVAKTTAPRRALLKIVVGLHSLLLIVAALAGLAPSVRR